MAPSSAAVEEELQGFRDAAEAGSDGDQLVESDRRDDVLEIKDHLSL